MTLSLRGGHRLGAPGSRFLDLAVDRGGSELIQQEIQVFKLKATCADHGDLPVMFAHITGIPVEETVLQFVPAGAATVTAAWIAVRARLRWPRHRGKGGDHTPLGEVRLPGRLAIGRAREASPRRTGGQE